MTNHLSHYDAICLRLSHERARVGALKAMKTSKKIAKEIEWREHNVRMIEKELEGEIAFLKKHHNIDMSAPMTLDEIMSDMELLDLLEEGI